MTESIASAMAPAYLDCSRDLLAASLVPSPHVAEDHQTKNARSVVDREGAVLLPDNKVIRDLPKEVRVLLNDAARCSSMSDALRATARPKAADAVASEILSLISQ